jgi:hypothetical protein
MDARTFSTRICSALAASLLAGALAGIVPGGGALAATCTATGVQPPNVGIHDNSLTGVAALSSCNAWAVGYYSNGTADQTLIEHWNGTSWKVVPSPNPGGSASYTVLSSVATTSATSAWAVGYYSNGTAVQTLIEHWNGTSWKVVPSPDPTGSSDDNALFGVAATSATDAWAVGYDDAATPDGGEGPPQTLTEHWNGTSWQAVPSPDPSAHTSELRAVAASSTGNAWAVGFNFTSNGAQKTLIEHWNGTSWQHVTSPNHGGFTPVTNRLVGVAVTSATNAWAVGSYNNSTGEQTLTEHWNGTNWAIVPSPDPGGTSHSNSLSDVALTSAGAAWAVGDYTTHSNNTAYQTLILAWNGTAWRQVASPNPGGPTRDNGLNSVAIPASGSGWAVGDYSNGTAERTLAAQCC